MPHKPVPVLQPMLHPASFDEEDADWKVWPWEKHRFLRPALFRHCTAEYRHFHHFVANGGPKHANAREL